MSIDNTKTNDRYSVEMDQDGAYIQWSNPTRRTGGNYTFELEFMSGALHATQTILDCCSYAFDGSDWNWSEGLAVEWRDGGVCWAWIGGSGSGGGITGAGIWNVNERNFLRVEVLKITTTPPVSDIKIWGNGKLLATFSGIAAACYLPIAAFRIGAALDSGGNICQALGGRVYQAAYRNITGMAMPRMDGQPYGGGYNYRWPMTEGTGMDIAETGGGPSCFVIPGAGHWRWATEIWRRDSVCNEALGMRR